MVEEVYIPKLSFVALASAKTDRERTKFLQSLHEFLQAIAKDGIHRSTKRLHSDVVAFYNNYDKSLAITLRSAIDNYDVYDKPCTSVLGSIVNLSLNQIQQASSIISSAEEVHIYQRVYLAVAESVLQLTAQYTCNLVLGKDVVSNCMENLLAFLQYSVPTHECQSNQPPSVCKCADRENALSSYVESTMLTTGARTAPTVVATKIDSILQFYEHCRSLKLISCLTVLYPSCASSTIEKQCHNLLRRLYSPANVQSTSYAYNCGTLELLCKIADQRHYALNNDSISWIDSMEALYTTANPTNATESLLALNFLHIMALKDGWPRKTLRVENLKNYYQVLQTNGHFEKKMGQVTEIYEYVLSKRSNYLDTNERNDLINVQLQLLRDKDLRSVQKTAILQSWLQLCKHKQSYNLLQAHSSTIHATGKQNQKLESLCKQLCDNFNDGNFNNSATIIVSARAAPQSLGAIGRQNGQSIDSRPTSETKKLDHKSSTTRQTGSGKRTSIVPDLDSSQSRVSFKDKPEIREVESRSGKKSVACAIL